MKNLVLSVFVVFLLYPSYACRHRVEDLPKDSARVVESDVAAVKALINEWVRLYNAEDFESLASVFYADNAVLMTPNAPARRTREAILLSYRQDAERNIEHVDGSIPEEIRVTGNLAVAWGTDTGTTTPRNGGEPEPYSLKWLMVFEHQSDGVWKCLYEMWNENGSGADKGG